MDGDTIELGTEGLGRLKFGIRDDLKRSWARKTRLQMHEEAKEKTPALMPTSPRSFPANTPSNRREHSHPSPSEG